MPYSVVEDAKNNPRLKSGRDRFHYLMESWRDVREERAEDMRFFIGDPWTEKEKKVRRDSKRPMLVIDELSQYSNQVVNDVRQNKRGVRIYPQGGLAQQDDADLREDWVRGVEYISSAQMAYITGFDCMLQGSYGFWKLETYFDSDESFDLSVRVVPITNPDTILYDDNCKFYDCRDAEDCFEIDFMAKEAFKRKFPDAEIQDFTDEIRQIAPEWIRDKMVQVASWWKVEKEDTEILLIQPKDLKRAPFVCREDHLPKEIGPKQILKRRTVEDRRVVEYIMNGVELLDTNDPKDKKGWPGQWIPIIPCWGKEMYVDLGTGSKRYLFSLIRLARDPQRLLNYYASQEMEEAKMTPRSPYMGPKGMFSDNQKQWETLNETPRANIEYMIPEGFPPGTKPERTPFAPNFQQYEIAKEAARRHIMAAIGISPLPTAAQRVTEKSGVALEEIKGERQQGSFHFIDNFHRSVECTGRQLNDVYTRVVDVPGRRIPVRDSQDKMSLKEATASSMRGTFNTTVEVGPSYDSQRREVAAFADTISQIQGVFPLIGDLLVRMRNLGPIGDEIAKRLTPPQFVAPDGKPLDPQSAQVIGQMNQQVQQLNAYCQKLEATVKQLTMEKTAKLVETSSRERIVALQEQTKLNIELATIDANTAAESMRAELAKITVILQEVNKHLLEQTRAENAQTETGLDNTGAPPASSPTGGTSGPSPASESPA